jgi:predicted nucleic acid-binding protein
VIVADTGAIVALVDEDDRFHDVLRELYERQGLWVLPWAIVPEVDYLLLEHLGTRVELEFVRDLAEGRWVVDWGAQGDLDRARELCEQYQALELGIVDAIVMATAERLRARAIATLDLRDFGAVALRGKPRLLPRDLE